MRFVQNLAKRIPLSEKLPSLEKLPTLSSLSQHRERITPKFAFFRRRIRLRGNSKVSIPLGVVLLFPCLVIILILVLIVRHPSGPAKLLIPAGAPPSIRYVLAAIIVSQLASQGLTETFYRRISEKYDKVFTTGCLEPEVDGPRANAAFVVLARDKELEGVIQSLKSIERHFNRWFHYPYVFLNDGDFSDKFKDTVQNYTSASVKFGKIDSSMWGFPDWVNADVAREGIRKQGDAAIMYGGMESYHHMCRFYSGYGLTAGSSLLLLRPLQLLLQARAAAAVRMVLAARAGD